MYVTFDNPHILWFLFLIPAIIISHIYFLKKSKAKAVKFANYETIKRIKGEKLVTKNIVHLSLRIAIILLLVAGVSGASFWFMAESLENNVVVALDGSPSMTTQDIEPNRFEAGKDFVDEFVSGVEGRGDLGLVVFGGVSVVEQTLTSSTSDFRFSLQGSNVIPAAGSDISGAIVTSTNLMLSDEERGRSIILISDGLGGQSSFIGDSIQRAIDYANENQVIVNTITLGTETGPVGFLPEYYDITATFSQEEMIRIAEETGGEHFYAGSREELMDNSQIFEYATEQRYNELNLSFISLFLALILVLVDWVLVNTAYRRIL